MEDEPSARALMWARVGGSVVGGGLAAAYLFVRVRRFLFG